jgi:tRNA(fMet)-specific endonuclease VapC
MGRVTLEKSLLDTDIFSEIRKGVNALVAGNADAYLAAHGRFTISTITVVEAVSGFHLVRRDREVERLLEEVAVTEVLPLDTEAAVIAGRIYADLRRTGQPIGWADPLIAATALRHDLALVTGNTSHYERIQQLGYDLQVENWRTL